MCMRTRKRILTDCHPASERSEEAGARAAFRPPHLRFAQAQGDSKRS
jgi:hypothetical protein